MGPPIHAIADAAPFRCVVHDCMSRYRPTSAARLMNRRSANGFGRPPIDQRLRPAPVPRSRAVHPRTAKPLPREPLLGRVEVGAAADRLARNAAPSRRPRYGLRRLVAGLVLVATLPVLFLAVSVFGALRTPGNEDFQAKWADWMRNHRATWFVNRIERRYYSGQAPPVGGAPKVLTTVVPPSRGVTADPRTANPLLAPKPVRLVVPGLPSEGTWRPTGPLVNGHPAMYVAEARPDAVHTSVLTTLVWIDPNALRIRLIPGAREPGGKWLQPPDIEGGALQTIVAAFNGGFRLKDAHGGFYAEQHESAPLRIGAASVAIEKSGGVQIGQWGRDVRLTHDTESVLQNLVLLVDHGRPVPGIDIGKSDQWGSTLGNKVYVWRSAIGVDASGAILYAAGPGLRASSLADVLARAGAVRAMTLDINPEWVTFNFFDHPDSQHPDDVRGRKLIDSMNRTPDRYLHKESRDFFTISTS